MQNLKLKQFNIIPQNIYARVLFQQAVETFFDPFLVVVDASRNDEHRDAVIGLDRRWNVLYVVYIECENDMIRIISARKATRKEREYYES
ncbi:BrnT family toxin [Nostoc sp.]|uniref:BrnT family toxin n=1 Tax=Nostoc sp. TaxID=1180 RepID=UPI002FFABA7C